MKVGIFRVSDTASDFYRTTLPLLTAAKYGQVESSQLWVANLYYEVANRTGKFMDVMTSDIFLLQRLGGQSVIDRMRQFIKDNNLKSKIVMDHDDDIFNTSPLSEHYADNGTEEVKIVHNGKLLHEWKDGININIKKNRIKMDDMKKTIGMVDMVTVTNENLANIFRPYNENVRILPNCIDVPEWNKLNIVRDNPEEIRIGWQGGHSHWEDLLMIRDPLKQICEKYPNVKIVMMGYMPVSMDKEFRQGQLEFKKWVEVPAHPYRLAAMDLDIGLIPLKKNQFNICKSPIKWVEYSALKIPSIASYV
jgi:hypothetical protein